MDSEKVTVIRNWKISTTLKDLQSFLEFCNFYQMFLENYDHIIWSLSKLLEKEAWHKLEEKELKAFNLTKALVLSDEVRAHYLLYRETCTKINTSDEVIASMLMQKQEDELWRLITYFSKTMSEEKMRYKIHDKEMLVIIRAIEEWWSMLIKLQNTSFLIITDH